MNSFLIVLCLAFAAATLGQDVPYNRGLTCYFCESDKVDPKDKYDTCSKFSPDINQVECSLLEYGDGLSRSNGIRVNPQLATVFKRETFSLDTNTTYKCITTTLRNDTKENFIRTCAPVKPNVKSVCDFIKAEVLDYEVVACSECSGELCNAAMLPISCIFVQLATFLIAMLFAKF